MGDDRIPRIDLVLRSNQFVHFYSWLQEGVWVELELGGHIMDMLCRQFELDPDYVDNRIQTVFLDGHPVDVFEKAVLKDGVTIAFSAAMPGLAGATLRRGGLLACFRSNISFRPEKAFGMVKRGLVRIRLYNLLIKELGPAILKKGIKTDEHELAARLDSLTKMIGHNLEAARVNEREATGRDLTAIPMINGQRKFFLQVEFLE